MALARAPEVPTAPPPTPSAPGPLREVKLNIPPQTPDRSSQTLKSMLIESRTAGRGERASNRQLRKNEGRRLRDIAKREIVIARTKAKVMVDKAMSPIDFVRGLRAEPELLDAIAHRVGDKVADFGDATLRRIEDIGTGYGTTREAQTYETAIRVNGLQSEVARLRDELLSKEKATLSYKVGAAGGRVVGLGESIIDQTRRLGRGILNRKDRVVASSQARKAERVERKGEKRENKAILKAHEATINARTAQQGVRNAFVENRTAREELQATEALAADAESKIGPSSTESFSSTAQSLRLAAERARERSVVAKRGIKEAFARHRDAGRLRREADFAAESAAIQASMNRALATSTRAVSRSLRIGGAAYSALKVEKAPVAPPTPEVTAAGGA